jgi:hypothetical protein
MLPAIIFVIAMFFFLTMNKRAMREDREKRHLEELRLEERKNDLCRRIMNKSDCSPYDMNYIEWRYDPSVKMAVI